MKIKMKERTAAIILMAGKGERFGSTLPKQLHELCGKKIYKYTLERFQESRLFEEIILVCHPDWMVQEEGVKVVAGGATRQESSYRGLLACAPDTQYVVIHDGVRPFVSLEILQENVRAVKQFDAVDTCIPSTDTIVHSVDGKRIDEIPLRSEYWRGQTPQSFAYDLILEAHQRTKRKNATDDCSLVLEMGYDVHIVIGSEENIKITTEKDILLAEQFST
jgi:2-C-methyl-D-erythritol 4-phosphate cytidylyltransferase